MQEALRTAADALAVQTLSHHARLDAGLYPHQREGIDSPLRKRRTPGMHLRGLPLARRMLPCAAGAGRGVRRMNPAPAGPESTGPRDPGRIP